MSNAVKLTFGYSNTDFTRDYKLSVDDSITSANIKNAILGLNSSLTGGTAGGLSAFFVADDFDPTNGVGYFTGITAAQREVTEVEYIDIEEAE